MSDAERIRPEKSEVFELICDNSLASSRPGWRPRVSLDDGLRQVTEYVEVHRSQFKADLYNV